MQINFIGFYMINTNNKDDFLIKYSTHVFLYK